MNKNDYIIRLERKEEYRDISMESPESMLHHKDIMWTKQKLRSMIKNFLTKRN
ncbi:MAG: hypothetical protein ACI4SQ_04240 [Eubacterium sp.]